MRGRFPNNGKSVVKEKQSNNSNNNNIPAIQ